MKDLDGPEGGDGVDVLLGEGGCCTLIVCDSSYSLPHLLWICGVIEMIFYQLSVLSFSRFYVPLKCWSGFTVCCIVTRSVGRISGLYKCSCLTCHPLLLVGEHSDCFSAVDIVHWNIVSFPPVPRKTIQQNSELLLHYRCATILRCCHVQITSNKPQCTVHVYPFSQDSSTPLLPSISSYQIQPPFFCWRGTMWESSSKVCK